MPDNNMSETSEEFLTKFADDLEKNPPEDLNGGHTALLQDLSVITKDACAFEFNDFRNTKYPAPKVELVHQLQAIIENTKNGKYDN